MNRRTFLTSGLATIAALTVARNSAFAASQPIGIQMYTLRTQAEKDLPGVLAALQKIGYQEIELYWNLYSRPAAELKRMIADHGLRAPSGHLDYKGFESKLDYAKELGLHYVICPMLPRDMWDSIDGFKRAAAQFNKWGEKAKSMGMVFGFHNHNYEFKKLGERNGFGTIVAETDPKLVSLEIDCYWITQAGHDPAQTLKALAGRVKNIHVKDRKPQAPFSQSLDENAAHFTEVGTGSIDWKRVLAAAKSAGVEHYYVEQDVIQGDPIASVTTSYNNLRKLLG